MSTHHATDASTLTAQMAQLSVTSWRVTESCYYLCRNTWAYHDLPVQTFPTERQAQEYLARRFADYLHDYSSDNALSSTQGNKLLDVWQPRWLSEEHPDDPPSVAEIRAPLRNNFPLMLEAMQLFVDDPEHPVLWSIISPPTSSSPSQPSA